MKTKELTFALALKRAHGVRNVLIIQGISKNTCALRVREAKCVGS